jgi:hypothetical protein
VHIRPVDNIPWPNPSWPSPIRPDTAYPTHHTYLSPNSYRSIHAERITDGASSDTR